MSNKDSSDRIQFEYPRWASLVSRPWSIVLDRALVCHCNERSIDWLDFFLLRIVHEDG